MVGLLRQGETARSTALALAATFQAHPEAARLTLGDALALADGDAEAFAALANRLTLAASGRDALSAEAFAAFKKDLLAISDPLARGRFVRALATPGQTQPFAEALARMPANPAWRNADVARAYAADALVVAP